VKAGETFLDFATFGILLIHRLTISEDGCKTVLSHENSSHILTKLIQSLGNDAAGLILFRGYLFCGVVKFKRFDPLALTLM